MAGRRRASMARDCREPRAALRRTIFLGGGGRRPASAPAMLLRISGDVVTAGLISFRVWFGPVPGSP
ncbi:hypothetical protein F511_46365 [Dorcoceras hygrometricum]|uniref:Uncharacterized protein n=1 Tax=Dorcoceras hygrometricum TaxID=472368 RepID=A0A2Z7A0M4_9LAMI|nr:hypothetical protein F511_46365 [Dorcoceras hygrometricum]